MPSLDTTADFISAQKDGECIAFVDGSYDDTRKVNGYGAVILCKGEVADRLSGSFTDPDFVALRNVSAELAGAIAAIEWAILHKNKKITIFYDYTGIEYWANGVWKTNKEITRNYAAFIREKRQQIEINFIKVLAHSGVSYNEEADKLAKNSYNDEREAEYRPN